MSIYNNLLNAGFINTYVSNNQKNAYKNYNTNKEDDRSNNNKRYVENDNNSNHLDIKYNDNKVSTNKGENIIEEPRLYFPSSSTPKNPSKNINEPLKTENLFTNSFYNRNQQEKARKRQQLQKVNENSIPWTIGYNNKHQQQLFSTGE